MHHTAYQITDKTDSRKLTEFLCKELLLRVLVAVMMKGQTSPGKTSVGNGANR